ncbi:MAG: tetratricopeptide repeat protein [Anaerovoracaceae bacterium]
MKEIRFLIALLLVICLCACGGSSKYDNMSLDELLDLGTKYLQEENYKEAVIVFEKAIVIDEKCVDAYIGLADAYICTEEYDKAEKILKKGYEITGDEKLKEMLNGLESGQINTSSVPVNTYNATEFIYRSKYYGFEDMTEAERQIINVVGTAVINNNMESMYDILDDYSCEMLSFSNTSKYTMWNDYKMEILFRPYEDDEDGDCVGSIEVELRAENGSGFLGSIYHTYAVTTEGRDCWFDYYYDTSWGTCPCVDWQWNGEVLFNRVLKTLWHSSDGATIEDYEDTKDVGVMKDCLRDGQFIKTGHYVEIENKYPEFNHDVINETVSIYADGVLMEEDGVVVDDNYSVANIKGERWGGVKDQSYLDRLFW